MDGFWRIVVTSIATCLVGILAGADMMRNGIEKDCDKMGMIRINDNVYICEKKENH